MKKILVEEYYSNIFYEVFATYVKDINSEEYYDEVVDNYDLTVSGSNSSNSVLFRFDNYIDAKECARNLVISNTDYNYSEVSGFISKNDSDDYECLGLFAKFRADIEELNNETNWRN